MNPNEQQLKSYRLRLQQISSIVETDLSKLTEEQLNWKPSAKSWSVAQCLQHLMLASQGYIAGMDKAINGYKAEGNSFKPYSATLSGKIMFFFVDPSIKIWVPAPPGFQPKQDEKYPAAVINSYKQLVKDISDRLELAKESDWNRMKVASPLVSLMIFNMGDTFEILTLHALRHLKQAQKVISKELFPV
jgi:hypothetical protein